MATKETKTRIKHEAQDRVMKAVMMATELSRGTDGNDEAIEAEMLKQMRRIEKFLGYEPGSWKVGA